MTLVFHAHSMGVPILVGDMLISGAEPDDYGAFSIPDHVDGVDKTFPIGSGYVPLRMKRKIFIVDTNLAIGLSGTLLHMRAFLKDIKERSIERKITSVEELQGFLDRYAVSEEGRHTLSKITALIVFCDQQKRISA